MSFRRIMSIITVVLIAVILYVSRHQLEQAWQLLGSVNLWLLALVVPLMLLGYYAVGEMVFSYLRSKNLIKDLPATTLIRLSLEMNFVNHVLPSGGVSGISYTTWRLGRYGVSSGKATMAQIVRHAMGFASFIALLLVAVLAVTIDGNINRWIILMSTSIAGAMIAATALGVYLISSPTRMHSFSVWCANVYKKIIHILSFKKKQIEIDNQKIERFFLDMHDDYMSLKKDARILIKPFWWGVVFTLADVAIFYVTFLALGTPVNPAPILIAYGMATIAGLFVVTPGGAGAYEALMVMVLAFAGLSGGAAIAGIVLARVIILVVTIGIGYAFYQHALMKFGRRDEPRTTDI